MGPFDEPANSSKPSLQPGPPFSPTARCHSRARKEHAEWLIRWTQAHHAVLLLDDAQRLALVAGRLVTGTSQESRIPINLRMTLLQRDPVIEALKSDAAYDATAVFLWLLVLAAMGAGAWQLAAILGGMKFLGRGSRAARQT